MSDSDARGPDKERDPRTSKAVSQKGLVPIPGQNPRAPIQGELDLQIDREIEIDGVGMGVLTEDRANYVVAIALCGP